MPKLYFKYGTMNSGKTTSLIQTAYNYREKGMDVLILKPSVDTKGEEKIVSRVGISLPVTHLVAPATNLYNLLLNEYLVWKKDEFIAAVLVDEAQFLTSIQIQQLFKFAVNYLPVICYGIRTDFQMKGFPGSSELLLLAHEIEEMKTICKCKRKAMINVRKVNGKYVFDGDQVLIDDKDEVEYEPMCGLCYYFIKRK